MRKIFEPYTSSVEHRLETLTSFKKRGMYTGVLAMPFIPYITDTKENIIKLIRKLKEIDVDFIFPGTLTLRPGRQKEVFLQTIKSYFPDLLNKIENLYTNNLFSGSPIYSYRKSSWKIIQKIFSDYEVLSDIPHYIYKNVCPVYDEIFILLNHMKELYSRKGIATYRLEKSIKLYTNWLLEEKKIFYRKRKLTGEILEEKLITLLVNDDFRKIIQNNKLANFLKMVLLEKKTFDYHNLGFY